MQKITQEMMKNARTSGIYGDIWTTRGKCVFCDLKDKYILYEENGIVLTVNLYPYIDGQLMAIPRQHITSPKQLSTKQWETIRKFNYLAKKLIRKIYGHKSMWSLLREGGVDAQMTVSEHLHIQFIPFDKKDLCEWNFRELKFTPLENVDQFKKSVKYFEKYNANYESKYKVGQLLPVVVDLLIVDKNKKILFAERNKNNKFKIDYLNLPGGHVDDPKAGLLKELKREVNEELNYDLDIKHLHLIDSQISHMEYENHSVFLNKSLPLDNWFVWNMYLLKDFDEHKKLKPGDDTAKLVWLSFDEALHSERISKGLKNIIKKAKKIIEDGNN